MTSSESKLLAANSGKEPWISPHLPLPMGLQNPALVSDIELEIKKTELEIKRLELKNGPTSIWRNPAILATHCRGQCRYLQLLS